MADPVEEFLVARGYILGQFNERQVKFLRANSYDGALNDMWDRFLKDNNLRSLNDLSLLSGLPGNISVSAFGDSITVGSNASPISNSWP